MEVEALPISISSVGTSPPRNRKRRSSTSSTSLSPAGFAKENCLVSKSVAKRKRTISESKQQEKQQQIDRQLRPTFWGWSPKQAKFKPKVMDGDGSLSDHPNPDSLALRSKWQPIVIEFFYYLLNIDNSSNHSKCVVHTLWFVHFHEK